MILLAQWHRYILGNFSNFTFADIRYLYEHILISLYMSDFILQFLYFINVFKYRDKNLTVLLMNILHSHCQQINPL